MGYGYHWTLCRPGPSSEELVCSRRHGRRSLPARTSIRPDVPSRSERLNLAQGQPLVSTEVKFGQKRLNREVEVGHAQLRRLNGPMARACKDNRIPVAEQAEQNRAYSFRLALACCG